MPKRKQQQQQQEEEEEEREHQQEEEEPGPLCDSSMSNNIDDDDDNKNTRPPPPWRSSWTCPYCTLENAGRNRRCRACECRRPLVLAESVTTTNSGEIRPLVETDTSSSLVTTLPTATPAVVAAPAQHPTTLENKADATVAASSSLSTAPLVSAWLTQRRRKRPRVVTTRDQNEDPTVPQDLPGQQLLIRLRVRVDNGLFFVNDDESSVQQERQLLLQALVPPSWFTTIGGTVPPEPSSLLPPQPTTDHAVVAVRVKGVTLPKAYNQRMMVAILPRTREHEDEDDEENDDDCSHRVVSSSSLKEREHPNQLGQREHEDQLETAASDSTISPHQGTTRTATKLRRPFGGSHENDSPPLSTNHVMVRILLRKSETTADGSMEELGVLPALVVCPPCTVGPIRQRPDSVSWSQSSPALASTVLAGDCFPNNKFQPEAVSMTRNSKALVSTTMTNHAIDLPGQTTDLENDANHDSSSHEQSTSPHGTTQSRSHSGPQQRSCKPSPQPPQPNQQEATDMEDNGTRSSNNEPVLGLSSVVAPGQLLPRDQLPATSVGTQYTQSAPASESDHLFLPSKYPARGDDYANEHGAPVDFSSRLDSGVHSNTPPTSHASSTVANSAESSKLYSPFPRTPLAPSTTTPPSTSTLDSAVNSSTSVTSHSSSIPTTSAESSQPSFPFPTTPVAPSTTTSTNTKHQDDDLLQPPSSQPTSTSEFFYTQPTFSQESAPRGSLPGSSLTIATTNSQDSPVSQQNCHQPPAETTNAPFTELTNSQNQNSPVRPYQMSSSLPPSALRKRDHNAEPKPDLLSWHTPYDVKQTVPNIMAGVDQGRSTNLTQTKVSSENHDPKRKIQEEISGVGESLHSAGDVGHNERVAEIDRNNKALASKGNASFSTASGSCTDWKECTGTGKPFAWPSTESKSTFGISSENGSSTSRCLSQSKPLAQFNEVSSTDTSTASNLAMVAPVLRNTNLYGKQETTFAKQRRVSFLTTADGRSTRGPNNDNFQSVEHHVQRSVSVSFAGTDKIAAAPHHDLAKTTPLILNDLNTPVTRKQASSRRVSFSTAVKRSRTLVIDPSPVVKGAVSPVGTGKLESCSVDNVARTGNLLGKGEGCPFSPTNPSFAEEIIMFTTAGSGKLVTASASSLEKAHQLLGEAKSSNDSSSHAPYASGVVSFTTAGSGKLVTASASSLAKAHQLLGEAKSSNDSSLHAPSASGVVSFTTAGSGKLVTASTSSLAKAHQLLGEAKSSNHLSCAVSFSAAGSGSLVTASADCVQKAYKLLTENEPSIHSQANRSEGILGVSFSTAGIESPVMTSAVTFAKVDALRSSSDSLSHCFDTPAYKPLSSRRVSFSEQGKESWILNTVADNLEPPEQGLPSGTGEASTISSAKTSRTSCLQKQAAVALESTSQSSCPNSVSTPFKWTTPYAAQCSFPKVSFVSSDGAEVDTDFIAEENSVALVGTQVCKDEAFSLNGAQDAADGSNTGSNANFESQAISHSMNVRPLGPCLSASTLKEAISKGLMTSCPESCVQHGVSYITLSLTSTNTEDLRFDPITMQPVNFESAGDLSRPTIGAVGDFRSALIRKGVDKNLLSDKWISNHLRWIVWKLAATERRFSQWLGGRYLTFDRAVDQLRSRFDIEIRSGRRSALRKILNRDASASHLMILCVADIIWGGNSRGCVIEVTDGWYSVRCSPDPILQKFIYSGLIKSGSKILVGNSVLLGADEGIDPLDKMFRPTDGPILKIFANSTRLARWNAKLGFVPLSPHLIESDGLFRVRRISDVLEGGGCIPLIDVVVMRTYPMQYLQRSPSLHAHNNPQARVLTEAEESERIRTCERNQLQLVERFAEDIEDECAKVSASTPQLVSSNKLVYTFFGLLFPKELDMQAPEIWRRFMEHASPSDFFDSLESDDKDTIRRWQEKRAPLLRNRVEQEIAAKLEETQDDFASSTPFIRVLVSSSTLKERTGLADELVSEEAVLTVWNPSEEQVETLKNGCILRLKNVVVRDNRFDGRLQLSGNSRTRIAPLQSLPSRRVSKQPSAREVTTIFRIHRISKKALHGKKIYQGYTNVVGIVIKTERSESQSMWAIILSDKSGLCLRVQGTVDRVDFDRIFTLPTFTHGGSNAVLVVGFEGLCLLPFDTASGCAVAEFSNKSQVTFVKPSSECSLGEWASTGRGKRRLASLALSLTTNLPQTRSTLVAIGFIVGFRVLSSQKLFVEVDCGNRSIQVWRVPLGLVQRLARSCEELSDIVALNFEDECKAHRLTSLSQIFRSRQSPFRFEITSMKENLGTLTGCYHEVVAIDKIKSEAFAPVFSGYFEG